MTSENDVTSLIETSNDDRKHSSKSLHHATTEESCGMEKPVMTIKQMTKDKSGMLVYLMKPIIMTVFGTLLIFAGIVLTVYHFIYEDSLDMTVSNPPYFTFGPVVFASGTVTFIFAIVWFTIKRDKWLSGSASPILAAMTAAISLPSTAIIMRC